MVSVSALGGGGCGFDPNDFKNGTSDYIAWHYYVSCLRILEDHWT